LANRAIRPRGAHLACCRAQQLDETQDAVGRGDVRGYGVALGYAPRMRTPGLTFGLVLEAMVWSTPYVAYEMCVDDCLAADMVARRGRAHPLTLGLGFAPSYRSGRITWFGGVFGRNHPSARREDVDVELGNGGHVRSGPLNLLLHAGVELALHQRLAPLVVVHQDVITDPVSYGPGIGVALTARFGQ
jgi:hypothetical protein